jgi:hypothetical protein
VGGVVGGRVGGGTEDIRVGCVVGGDVGGGVGVEVGIHPVFSSSTLDPSGHVLQVPCLRSQYSSGRHFHKHCFTLPSLV